MVFQSRDMQSGVKEGRQDRSNLGSGVKFQLTLGNNHMNMIVVYSSPVNPQSISVHIFLSQDFQGIFLTSLQVLVVSQ